jgi:hypothetical protein
MPKNEGVRAWYRAYLDWLLNSRNGFEESNAHNNHGTWYSAQVVAYALYTRQPEVAKRELEIARIRRGGEDRNRTCLGGFAGRCITSLLPRRRRLLDQSKPCRLIGNQDVRNRDIRRIVLRTQQPV